MTLPGAIFVIVHSLLNLYIQMLFQTRHKFSRQSTLIILYRIYISILYSLDTEWIVLADSFDEMRFMICMCNCIIISFSFLSKKLKLDIELLIWENFNRITKRNVFYFLWYFKIRLIQILIQWEMVGLGSGLPKPLLFGVQQELLFATNFFWLLVLQYFGFENYSFWNVALKHEKLSLRFSFIYEFDI